MSRATVLWDSSCNLWLFCLRLCTSACSVALSSFSCGKHANNVFQVWAFSLCIDWTYPRHTRVYYISMLVVLYETDKDRQTDMISPSKTGSCINILVGTKFQSTSQIWGKGLTLMSKTTVRCFYTILIHLSFHSDFRQVMDRARFRGRDRVKTMFLDRIVIPGSTKNVDLETCLTWQNHGDHWSQWLAWHTLPANATHYYSTCCTENNDL